MKKGDRLRCAISGQVEIHDFDERGAALRRTRTGRLALIIHGDLLRDLRLLSRAEIAERWGVHPMTVSRWRVALEIEETPGDRARRVTTRRARGPVSERARAALLRAARRPMSAEARRKVSEKAKGKPKPHQQLSDGARIRLFFEAEPGVTNEEVAKTLGIHRVTVAKYRHPESKTPEFAERVRTLLARRDRAGVRDLLQELGIERTAGVVRFLELVRAGRSVPAASRGAGQSVGWGYRLAKRLLRQAVSVEPRRKEVEG